MATRPRRVADPGAGMSEPQGPNREPATAAYPLGSTTIVTSDVRPE
jgi:hypothetical protein